MNGLRIPLASCVVLFGAHASLFAQTRAELQDRIAQQEERFERLRELCEAHALETGALERRLLSLQLEVSKLRQENQELDRRLKSMESNQRSPSSAGEREVANLPTTSNAMSRRPTHTSSRPPIRQPLTERNDRPTLTRLAPSVNGYRWPSP